MKYFTTLVVSLFFVGAVFAKILPDNLQYEQKYCKPNGESNSACYNIILDALTVQSGETMSSIVVQNKIFSDDTIAEAITDSSPTQLLVATSINYPDAVVASTIYHKKASMYYVHIPGGVYDVKTAVSLKRRTSDGYYKLTIVSGNYNFTQQASLYDYESVVQLSTDWIKEESSDYYNMITLAASYLSRLYTLDQLRVLLAKAARVSYNAEYSSACDYFGPTAGMKDPALNAIDKKLCMTLQKSNVAFAE